MKIREWMKTFGIGAIGYASLELLWRKRTHWTMAVTGGICFTGIYELERLMSGQRLWKKCLAGTAMITAVELAAGCLLNKKLHLGVWDYSRQPFNLNGQICPLFSALWFMLCIPLFPACKILRQKALPAARIEVQVPLKK